MVVIKDKSALSYYVLGSIVNILGLTLSHKSQVSGVNKNLSEA